MIDTTQERKALTAAMTDGNGMLLPHQKTFSSLYNTMSGIYSARWDEAIRHGQASADAMRRDAYFKSMEQERISPLTRWKWEVVADDSDTVKNPKDPYSVAREQVRKQLDTIVRKTYELHQMRNYLGYSLWYGRYGSQVRWDRRNVSGYTRWVVGYADPVQGDKIHFHYDGTPGVMVRPGEMKGFDVRTFDAGGPVMLLDRPSLRQRFIISKHHVEDGSYMDPQSAGRRHGVGLRDYVYWAWWLRDEMLSWLMDFMEKVGSLGLVMVYYTAGNPTSKAEAEKTAKEMRGKNAIAVPRSADGKGEKAVELVTPQMAGVGFLKDVVTGIFESHIERLFVGQTLSAGTEGSGLGGSGVAGMHTNTKHNLLCWDAENQAAAFTSDLVRAAVALNFPGVPWEYSWQYRLPDPEAKEKLDAVERGARLGLKFKASEVRSLIGLTAPDDDDETIGGPPDQPPPGGPQLPVGGLSGLQFATQSHFLPYSKTTGAAVPAQIAALLADAMAAALEADDEESYERLADLASDPEQLAGVFGYANYGKLFSYEWVSHGQSASGKPRWKDSETGKVRYQISKPGSRGERQKKANATLAKESLEPIKSGTATPEQLGQLAENIGALTKSELRQLREELGAKFGGADPKRAEMVSRLKEFISNPKNFKPKEGKSATRPDGTPAEPNPDQLQLFHSGGFARAYSAEWTQGSDEEGVFWKSEGGAVRRSDPTTGEPVSPQQQQTQPKAEPPPGSKTKSEPSQSQPSDPTSDDWHHDATELLSNSYNDKFASIMEGLDPGSKRGEYMADLVEQAKDKFSSRVEDMFASLYGSLENRLDEKISSMESRLEDRINDIEMPEPEDFETQWKEDAKDKLLDKWQDINDVPAYEKIRARFLAPYKETQRAVYDEEARRGYDEYIHSEAIYYEGEEDYDYGTEAKKAAEERPFETWLKEDFQEFDDWFNDQDLPPEVTSGLDKLEEQFLEQHAAEAWEKRGKAELEKKQAKITQKIDAMRADHDAKEKALRDRLQDDFREAIKTRLIPKVEEHGNNLLAKLAERKRAIIGQQPTVNYAADWTQGSDDQGTYWESSGGAVRRSNPTTGTAQATKPRAKSATQSQNPKAASSPEPASAKRYTVRQATEIAGGLLKPDPATKRLMKAAARVQANAESRKLADQLHYKWEQVIAAATGGEHVGKSATADVVLDLDHASGQEMSVILDGKLVTSADQAYTISDSSRRNKILANGPNTLVAAVAMNLSPNAGESRGVYLTLGASSFTAKDGSAIRLMSAEEMEALGTEQGLRVLGRRVKKQLANVNLEEYRSIMAKQSEKGESRDAANLAKAIKGGKNAGRSDQQIADTIAGSLDSQSAEVVAKAAMKAMTPEQKAALLKELQGG